MNGYSSEELCGKIVGEGIVLLENKNGLLPLKNRKLAVFGRAQVDTVRCGTGSASTLCDKDCGIISALEKSGFDTDRELSSLVRGWCADHPLPALGIWGAGHSLPEMPVDRRLVSESLSRGYEVALIVIARAAGENSDVHPIKGDGLLSDEEIELIKNVTDIFPHTALAFNCGNLPELSFLDEFRIDAVLSLSLPGEGGRGLADILSGKLCPSGKLTDTVPMRFSDEPNADIFGKEGGGLMQEYKEDIFVGYRYFGTFAPEKVRYPFGYGLSYTDFAVNVVSFSADETVKIKCRVTNTGKCAGKEVLQLYAHKEGILAHPSLILCGFEKTRLLFPSEEATVIFNIPKRRLASFDDTGLLGIDSWWLEKGKVTFYAGQSSVKLTECGSLYSEEDVCLEKCTHMDTELSVRKNGAWQDEKLICKPVSGDFAVGGAETVIIPSKDTFTVCFRSGGTYLFGTSDIVSIDGCDYVPENGEIIYSCTAGIRTVVTGGKRLTVKRLERTVNVGTDTLFEGGDFSDGSLWLHINPVTVCGELRRAVTYFHAPESVTFSLEVKTPGVYGLSFLYSNKFPEKHMCDVFSVMASNVEQPMSDKIFRKTACDGKSIDGEKAFIWSDPEPIRLGGGSSLMQIISTSPEACDIAAFRLLYMPDAKPCEPPHILKPTADVVASDDVGNTFLPLTRDDDKLSELISSLSDFELASLTCGNDGGMIGGPLSLGIPEISWSDGPSGLRKPFATVSYPCGTLLAQSWNLSLAEEFGRAVGEESEKLGVGVWLAPGLNIHRNPLCGRNFEYYSEDPLVSGMTAAAVVRGYQSTGLSAMPKHFLCNNTEFKRLSSDSLVSAKAIREIYLYAFEIMLREGKPDSLMTSYNMINGTKVPEDRVICTDILRSEFGFEGVEVTDWCNNSIHSKELAAGHDLKMSYGDPKAVASSLASGELDRKKVERSAHRILSFVARLSEHFRNK